MLNELEDAIRNAANKATSARGTVTQHSLEFPVSTALWFMTSGMALVATITAIVCHLFLTPAGIVAILALGLLTAVAFVTGSFTCPSEEDFYTIPSEEMKWHVSQTSLKSALWLLLSGMFMAVLIGLLVMQFNHNSFLVAEIVCGIGAVMSSIAGYVIWEEGLSDEQLLAIYLKDLRPGETIKDSSVTLPLLSGPCCALIGDHSH